MAKGARELFISYSRADDAFVQGLMRELDEQAVPYWSDRKIEAGGLWIDEIESAIKRASVFVLLISPSFAASKNALFEAGIAVGRAHESGARIVPILLPGASLPPVLRGYHALRADSMTIKDVAEQLRAVAATVDQKPERIFKELRLFVSSPADVTAERECVSRISEELNAGVGAAKGVALQRYTWESFPPSVIRGSVHGTVSEALRHVDIFLLILAARLGTPVGINSGSGMEEEFQMVVENSKRTGRPQVLCYLKTAPVQLKSVDEAEEFGRVLKFRDRLKRDHLVYEFESLDDLERAVRHHLTEIILSESHRLPNG
jgi:hypothetical protein